MTRYRTLVLVVIIVAVAAGVAAAGERAVARPIAAHLPRTTSLPSASPAPALSLLSHTPALARKGTRSLSDVQWDERTYTGNTGDLVQVAVSTSYDTPGVLGQKWADFFSGLIHGGELQLLRAYIAPLAEVQEICGARAVGCYGDDRLVVTNEPAAGFTPEEVARHEYGHHIAFHRLNSPWSALDWGPKRWASAADICARVHDNDAFPGDESLLYRRNPGEAFAEAYRVLVDSALGQSQPSWPLVDPSFYPDAGALAAIEQDVAAPWSGPTTRIFRGRFSAGKRRALKLTIATPLDGTLTARLSVPPGVGSNLALVSGDSVLATDQRSGGSSTLRYQVCGQRSLVIRAAASSGVRPRFALSVTAPEIADAHLSAREAR